MLVYLSKKIAIPGQIKLNCISWNRDQGWIACGGDAGLLKVLKLEQATGADAQIGGLAAPSNLSMNQTLEGHTGGVVCVTWNPLFRKLTTSDESGLIIVWMMHNGMWYEEMINNRNKSIVRDMKWTADGRKICIIYEDGAVIVGSVDGNRLWGKELNLALKYVEWSPDSKLILFVTMSSDVLVYDSEGNRLKSLQLPVREIENSNNSNHNHMSNESSPIVGIHWYASESGTKRISSKESIQPSLCIALQNGAIQLSRGDDDPLTVFINTEMVVSNCRWNSGGTVLAITGYQTTIRGDTTRSINQVKFYDSHGQYLRSIRIPGDNIAGLTWEGSGLRIALAVDSNIFFANIRPTYTWAYLLNGLVMSYGGSERNSKNSSMVFFWDLTSGEVHSKNVGNLKFLAAHGDICAVVVSEKDDRGGRKQSAEESKDNDKANSAQPPTTNRCIIQLRNSIGITIDSKVLPVGFMPLAVCMGPCHVIACNERTVYSWLFSSGNQNSNQNQRDDDKDDGGMRSISKIQSKERMFDIDNINRTTAQPPETYKMVFDAIEDPTVCCCCSDEFLVIARKSGVITRYSLPHLNIENTYIVHTEPYRISLNSTSTRLALIDGPGVLHLLDLDARIPEDEEWDPEDRMRLGQHFGRKLGLERRDVWDMLWSEDDEELLCIVEKTKMVIFRGEEPEEPVVSSGYLARFKDLEVRVVMLDDLLLHPDQPTRNSVVDFETKSLREVRERISLSGLQDGYACADKNKNSHPRLWRLLATAALENLDLNMAERSFVRCGDYYGIRLVQQLRSMPDKMKARAEVAVYMQNFDEAEAIYREIDREDLAVQMRKRIGDYSRVVYLLRNGTGSDLMVREAWNQIGEQYADKFQWKKAAQYFVQSRNLDRLAECLYRLSDFTELAKLSRDVADDTPLLAALAIRFEAVGMHEEAVDCHLRGGNPKAAVDCCVLLNRWDVALELAEKHEFPQVEGLLTRYAASLASKSRWLEAVELYRRANRPTEAALLIGDIAEQAARRDVRPSLAKKLHVLAALEVERHRKRTMDLATQSTIGGGGTIAQATAATLETLMMTSLDTQLGAGSTVTATMADGGKKASKAFGNAWRGAAAYHYYMLAQRQYYSGAVDASMKTSIKLCEYDDILEPRDIYSLLCLTSIRNKFYGICSKAFVKLETLPNLSDVDRDLIQTLAVKIFVKHPPQDPAILPDPYIKCLELGKSFKACVISGRAIQESDSHLCKTCRHPMLEHEKSSQQNLGDGGFGVLLNCPLCHTPLTVTSSSSSSGGGSGGNTAGYSKGR